jgi:membrane-associated phospholipid phosphatase
MKHIIASLVPSTFRIFRGKNALWHLFAIVFTYICVVSGFDWHYFIALRTYESYLFPAAPLGFLVPVLLIGSLLLFGVLRKNTTYQIIACALIQAVIISSVVSDSYKALTGRAHPPLFGGKLVDISHEFHFGFLEGGVFWGWPSSHATVTFALAAVLWILCAQNRWIRFTALTYALYIGIGVSATIHWFSDAVSGAIIGSVIGVVVGRYFSALLTEKTD